MHDAAPFWSAHVQHRIPRPTKHTPTRTRTCTPLQGTLGATFFQQAHNMIQAPEKIPNILGAALPDSSNFFMQFIAMRALFLVWLRLCMPHGGVWQNWLRYICCPAACCATCNTGGCCARRWRARARLTQRQRWHMLLRHCHKHVTHCAPRSTCLCLHTHTHTLSLHLPHTRPQTRRHNTPHRARQEPDVWAAHAALRL
jgi:hypothetical protein